MISQYETLKGLLERIETPKRPNKKLVEILYTAAETGMFCDIEGVGIGDALSIYALVELSKSITEEELEAIKL